MRSYYVLVLHFCKFKLSVDLIQLLKVIYLPSLSLTVCGIIVEIEVEEFTYNLL